MKSFNTLLIELSLGKAGVFAAGIHSGQHRKTSGAPYIVHPTAVVRILQAVGVKDKNILVAAFLHDTIEDGPATYNKIKREFNKEVADMALAVTSSSSDIARMGKPVYLAKKMIGLSSGALMIKLADRLHNTEDLGSMPPEKAKAYAQQTDYIFQELKSARRMSSPAKKLMKKTQRQISKFLR